MKSFRFILLLLCCIVSWACNSVLGTDDFKKSGCIEGEVRCAGDRPERCSSGSWQAEGACNGQTCIDGACVGECAPDKKQCNGQQPQRCDELSGNWTNDRDPCTNTTCSDGACVGICAPGQTSCSSDNFPRTCDSNGQWANAANACANQTCIDGACVGECAPGKRCLGVTPQHCDAQGTWASDPLCQVDEYCEGGECTLECVPLDWRCWNNTPQVCNETKRWQDIQGPCEHQTCNPTNVMCEGTCAPDERQCNGAELQKCNASGSWQHELDCPLGCIDGACLSSCMPSGVEICDGLDNDCNGFVDDNIAGVGDPCSVPEFLGTSCEAGRMECSLGQVGEPVCVSKIPPGSLLECCDGFDNDCNLIVDDGVFCCPNDGKISGNETDLDCGGSCAQKCADGRGCNLGIDCISGNCFQNLCNSATCADGLKNGAESDVDCGEVCPMQCLVGDFCFTDNDCISKSCHSASKKCVPNPKGSPCAFHEECTPGYCVDGVCCSSSCTGTCQACTTAKKGSGVDGDCGPIAVNTDPDNECQGMAPQTCGTTGVCSGEGSCATHPVGTICGPTSCTNATTENPADTCDGQGVCIQRFDKMCQTGYACVGGSCKTTCVSNGECDTGYFCDAPTCRAKQVNGDSCTNGMQCQSGNCVDGVCCNTACAGACNACNVAGSLGTCAAIPSNTDPDNDCNPGSCDGLGQCQIAVGSLCSSANQCISGFCVDTVCCDSACTGLCRACAAVISGGINGFCSNISAGSDPQNECAGTCDGSGLCQP